MSGRPHHDENLDDTPEPDSFEVEGIQAFNRLTGAVQGLESRLGALEHGLGSKATQAERAASTALTAAQNVIQAAERAHAATRADARSWTAYAALIVAGSVLSAGIVGYVLGERAGQATARRPATGPHAPRPPPRAGPTHRPGKPPWLWTGQEASISSPAAMGRAGRSSSGMGEGSATRTPPRTGRSTAGPCPEPFTTHPTPDLGRRKGG